MAKNSFSIDNLTDKEDIIKKIINQTNSLNKKIKAFNENMIEEHSDYLKAILTDQMVTYNKSGSISKSKKQYEDKHIMHLKRTLSALHKMNNHNLFGTVNKYQKEVTRQVQDVKDFATNFLEEKGYDENFIREVVHDKQFYGQLFLAFKDMKKEKYTSKQVIEKIYLSYKDNPLSDKDLNKALNNIEYARNTAIRLEEEKRQYEEFLEQQRNSPKR